MATSGSSDFSRNRNEIITMAYSMGGITAAGSQPTSTQVADASILLNMLVKHLGSQPHLWLRKEVTHTITPGTQSYTVGTGLNISTARPLSLEYCRRKNTSNTEVPIDVASRTDYMSLPTKSTQGAPNLVYYDPQLANGVLYVWPTGDTTNNKLVLTFRRPIEDFDTASNDADFPQEWTLYLTTKLCALLLRQLRLPSDEFAGEAERLLAELMQHDEEHVSFFVKPRRF